MASASRMPSTKSQVYKLITMAAWSWRGPLMQDTTLQHITRVLQSSNSSISKTRIIDITINYIAIDMKAQVRKVRVEEATSRWRSLLTTFMIRPQERRQITATRAEPVKGHKGSIQIVGLRDRTRASYLLGRRLLQARRYPCKTLIIK